MKILLTGHKGFVGRRLHAALHEHEVTGLDCDNDIEAFRLPYGCNFDVVIHCGGLADSSAAGNQLWQLNYKATADIADFCAETKTKLIFFSSAAAHNPHSDYGWSKHCAEFYIRTVCNVKPCILRPFNIWSYDEAPPRSIVALLLNEKLRSVYRGCLRDFVNVDDIVDAVLLVVEKLVDENDIHGTFSLGTGAATDVETLADLLYAGTNIYRPAVVERLPAGFVKRVVAQKLNLLPDWEPTPLSEHFSKMKEIFDESHGD